MFLGLIPAISPEPHPIFILCKWSKTSNLLVILFIFPIFRIDVVNLRYGNLIS